MIRFRKEKESSNTAQTFLSRSVVKRRCQVKIVREGHEAGDGGGPGVVDEIEPLGDGESVDAGVQKSTE